MAYPTHVEGAWVARSGGKGGADAEPPLTDTPEHSGLPVFLEGNFPFPFSQGGPDPTATASLKTVARQRDNSLPDPLTLGEMVGN